MKKAMKQSTLFLVLNGITILLLISVAVFSILTTIFREEANRANTDRYDLTYYANRFMDASTYLTDEVRAYSATGDRTHYDNYQNEVNHLKNREAGLAKLNEIGITEEERQMIDDMSAISDSLVPLEESAMDKVQAGRNDEALNYVYGREYSQSIAQINTLRESFLKELDERALQRVQELDLRCNMIQAISFLFMLLAGIMQIMVYLITKRQILKPVEKIELQMKEIADGKLSVPFELEPDTSELGQLIQAIHYTKGMLKEIIQDITYKLEEMSKGNLNISVEAHYPNDFGPIKNSMNQIIDSLNDALGQIHTSSDQVLVGSQQVADGSQSLAQGATEQASAVEEISATLTSITHSINKIADQAKSARECSVSAASDLGEADEEIHGLNRAMEEIDRSSAKIGTIIKTIEDISFQTNILALNAAVEAARAGSAGKGFAVVADEVRNLATKSAEAVKDTSILVENSMSAVKVGINLVQESTEKLKKVVMGAKESTDYVEAIAISSEQQSKALDQANEGVQQISEVISTTAATSEESAASSQELSEQADLLKKLVGKFLLRSERKTDAAYEMYPTPDTISMGVGAEKY